MKKVSKEIIVRYGVRRKLQKDCNVSDKTVIAALRYENDTEAGRLVRDRAIKFYGGAIVKYDK